MIEESKVPRTAMLESCPICVSKNTKHYFTSRDRLHGTPGEFEYHLCNSCGTVFQNPMVIQEDLHLCYPSEYTPYNYKNEIPDIDFDALPNGSFRNNLRKAVVNEVRGKAARRGAAGVLGKILAKSALFRERAFYGLVIDELLPKGQGAHFALDLGCGAGWLMEKLKKVGWAVEGLEWNEAAAETAREVTKCKVWTGDFREVDIPKGKYQVIVLNHVFEHFSDPKDALLRLRELLAENGKLVLFYPNPHAFGAGWHNADWFPWEVPRHLILPTPKAVRLIAREKGFTRINVFTRAFYASEQWIRSKAYKNGLNPERERPNLGLTEKLGLITEHFLTVLGFEKGCETVAVLKK
ncbi:MAG TPA: class I SAM-dependent methyltransferase [Pyrinomonadaceae bacterium]|jgi:2-polyprenyl-3-methyl-5-hydroxy-6-metoxy-1,4-benzoquinol methylase